ncbi:MAG: DUF364 domain-containing protein [Bacteroidales bacterium]|nr:DUF364 domain-containing protein [Bacteroidales bacterium]
MIIDQTIEILKNNHKNFIDDLLISELRIGLFLTGIKLSDGSIGVSGTVPPPDSELHCNKENRDFGDFTPCQFKEKKIIDLLEYKKKNPLIESLKVAALNAISSKIIENSTYKILHNTDPIDLIDLDAARTIALVGAFPSYIRRISSTKNKLFVLELNEGALDANFRKYFVPAERYPAILPVSDIVIITGLTLVNDTFDKLLENTMPESQVIVTGPSSSFIPDVLFEKGVKIIGSVRITDPETALNLISEGGTGYHLFRYCAEKICILRDP